METNNEEKNKVKAKKHLVKDISIIATFLALLIASTFIRIPMPFGDYLTLQLEIVILIGFILGPTRALITTSLYVFMGIIGIPVFAAGGGISYIFRPSFGYMYGFIIASFVVGILSTKVKKMNILKSILIALLGIILIYICGYIHKYIIYNFYLENESLPLTEIILSTMAFEVPKDLILGLLCGVISIKLRKIYLKIYNQQS